MLLIGARYRSRLARPLERLGMQVCWLPDDAILDSRLAGHTDLRVFAAKGQAVVGLGVYPHIVNILTNLGYSVRAVLPQGPSYPADAGLCICDTGSVLLCNPKTAAPQAVALADGHGHAIAVAQGYTRCAVCVVTRRAVITADHGIVQAVSKHPAVNMDVLEITPGYVALDGFEYGFIGGASFKLNPNTIAFTGTLDRHPDKAEILSFIARHGVKPVFLTNDPIFDIGGAVMLE
ncbi:MAG: hypothetical protein LUG57_08840 [Oscillospiraceae bacterium]|nr:hypothetical protein [Oscillospiraceae bacterium]